MAQIKQQAVSLDDPKSESLMFAAYGSTGSEGSVTFPSTPGARAWDCHTFVEPGPTVAACGESTAPPTNLTQPYTLHAEGGRP